MRLLRLRQHLSEVCPLANLRCNQGEGFTDAWTETPTEAQPFYTIQASTVVQAIRSCWSEEVFIPDLGHRFWRLTLQVNNVFAS